MKLSVFLTITNPDRRGDLYKECIQSILGFADELVIVDGGTYDGSLNWIQSLNDPRIHIVYKEWPHEFNWPLIGESFHYGYENCTGDAVMHLDCDFIIHNHNFNHVRSAAQNMINNRQLALSFYKYQFVVPDRYNLKSRLTLMVNKRDYGNYVRFDGGGEGDLCQPSFRGKLIKPGDVPESRLPFYNYEKILKTKEQIMEDQGRMERAWKRHFGDHQMSSDGSNNGAYEKWIEMQKGRMTKAHKQIPLEDHPIIMQETLANIQPEQFGYSMFGHFYKLSYL